MLQKRWWALIIPILTWGCGDAEPQDTQPAPVPEIASSYSSDETGVIEGQVRWDGPLPEVPLSKIHGNHNEGKEALTNLVRKNPNAPVIDSATRGLEQAVVFLRGIDPARSRPWDHLPIVIDQSDLDLAVLQGNERVHAGFVHQGDEIAAVSRDKFYHALRASGAAFFTLPFIDANKPTRRRLDKNGLVELSSGTGCYWMRAYLFVADHPYFARTDKEGRFKLDHVPAGKYQLACWLPNWKIARHDRDPETALIIRMYFEPPLLQETTVEVISKATTSADFTMGTNTSNR